MRSKRSNKEIVAEFMRLEADAKAKFNEDERRNISRQGDSLTFVGTQMPSTTPSQDLIMRTVSFDEIEESSKRRRVGSLFLNQAVGEPAIATPTTKMSQADTGRLLDNDLRETKRTVEWI